MPDRTSLRQRDVAATPDELVPAGLPASEPGGALATTPDLRRFLPGIEPERQVDDWGRSERVAGALDRVLLDFLYHLWFRVSVEGVEHVPAAGPGLLVSNHSGALPPDAMMIMKAVREEHAQGRDVRVLVEHFFKGYPGFSMLLPKIGAVPAHPANVQRLLHDEDELVLVFPEGAKGTTKLYKDRYKLRRFGRGGFVEAAMRARAPIVPIALVGAEESQPVLTQLTLLKKLTGLIYTPLTPTFPHFGIPGALAYLPAKFTIRFLPAVPTDAMGDRPWEDKALVQTIANDVRYAIQESLLEMVGHRRSVWLG